MSDGTMEEEVEAAKKELETLKAQFLEQSKILGNLINVLGVALIFQPDGKVFGGLNTSDPVQKQGILTKIYNLVMLHEKALSERKVIVPPGVGLGLDRRN